MAHLQGINVLGTGASTNTVIRNDSSMAEVTDNAAFNQAVEKANQFSKKPSDAELLRMYGLYKQATVGDVNTERPGMFDFKGRHKWDAWAANKGMSQAEAQEKYIALIEKLSTDYS